MEAMPEHDPLPHKRAEDFERAALAWARYKQTMKWMVVVAAVTVLLSLIYLKSFGDQVPIHMLIATALGAGLIVLLGAALMTLTFLSSSSGHDHQAAGSGHTANEEDE